MLSFVQAVEEWKDNAHVVAGQQKKAAKRIA
jgi:hypothetical protein